MLTKIFYVLQYLLFFAAFHQRHVTGNEILRCVYVCFLLMVVPKIVVVVVVDRIWLETKYKNVCMYISMCFLN